MDRFALDELSFARLAQELSVLVDQPASAVCCHRITLELDALPDGVIVIGMHVVYANRELFLRIVEHDVRIGTGNEHTFLRSAAEELGRICGAEFNRFIEGNPAFVRFGKHVGIHVFDACAAVRDLGEVVLAPIFLICLVLIPVACCFDRETAAGGSGGVAGR